MRVILVSKNFAAHKGVSHIGLGVSGLCNAKTLLKHGILAEVWQVVSSNELRQKLNLDFSKKTKNPITHVIISAPWIPIHALNHLCSLFPRVNFAVNCHSNVGFLMADSRGIELLRGGLDLEAATHNFHMAANSKKMCRWVEDAYGNPCAFLPNLYYFDDMHKHQKPLWDGGRLRIGVFGATRPLKNLVSAVGAAIEISHQLKVHTQIFLNSGRTEGGGNTILNAIKAMTVGLPNVELEQAGWSPWPTFRRLVSSMHLLISPSYSESYNMVCSDGIFSGVPSVVSEAIDWAPQSWIANVDDVFDIAQVGRRLLMDHRAAHEGLEALEHYVENGVRAWKSFLKA